MIYYDPNEICPYCKNQDTIQLMNKLDIEYYGKPSNKVMYCICGATWHYKEQKIRLLYEKVF